MHDGFLAFLVCVLVYGLCCLLNGGIRYRECPLREAILYYLNYLFSLSFSQFKEDSYEGSRADYVSTELFDDQHHFLLDTLVNHTHSSPPTSLSDTNQQRTVNYLFIFLFFILFSRRRMV